MTVTTPDNVATKATWRQKFHALTELPEQVKTANIVAGIGICIAIVALAVAIVGYAHTHNTKAHVNGS